MLLPTRPIDMISIHAPRTGSDYVLRIDFRVTHNFNPRSPHGERPKNLVRYMRMHHFNPRSPHGERRRRCSGTSRRNYFNPRSPHGERRQYPPR